MNRYKAGVNYKLYLFASIVCLRPVYVKYVYNTLDGKWDYESVVIKGD